MKDYTTIMTVVFIFVIIMTGVNIVGDKVFSNSNLDQSSKELIVNINYDLNKSFNDELLTETDPELSLNSSSEGLDPFAQEYNERKTSAIKKENIVQRIIAIPDLILISLGVNVDDVKIYKALIITMLLAALGFATYRAFFGAGRVSEN